MKDFEKQLMDVVNDYADDYSADDVLALLFPGRTIGEIVVETYNAGLIATDDLETFLED